MATGSQIGGAVSGAATGAKIGSLVAPGIGTAIGGIIGGIGGLFGGDDGSAAETARAYADFNAKRTIEAGGANAKMILDVSSVNNSVALKAAELSQDISDKVVAYNANLRSFLGDYNAGLLEDQAKLVWSAADLSLEQMAQEHARAMGNLQVGYGASGVLSNQDSALIAKIDAKTQQELDVMVVTHNADIQAQRLLDAAAKSRWDGNMEAATLQFNGQMANLTNANNTLLATTANGLQTTANAQMTFYNANIQADKIKSEGDQQYQNYQNADNQALVNGLFKAGVTYGADAIKAMMPTSSTSFTGAGSLTPEVSSFTGYKSSGMASGFSGYLNQKYGTSLLTGK